ncbi:TRAP transporter small permease [Ottowia sp. SB7-C50]|jgi:TRAP-type C4-dicarboxylate transport system permease small subunit|uniref:TRAP transporter small permease n=1 Tax=Ottowia sp. SB7-C50 TaxID=3081231 RepID=UPI002954D8C8|nr:TRAP transporter small permease [Ottowia sp. SB7-C50]WOP16780.1 TRAP transporter small permease [Ottowia sp. SB7-C50]
MIKRLINGACHAMAVLMVGALAVMVVLVFANVVLRYAFNSGIAISEELSRWLFVWMTFLGAVVALNERGHLGTDALVSRLPVAGKKLCLLAGHLLMLYICWLLFQGSLEQARLNWETTSAAMEVSVGLFFYASGVVCAVGCGVILLHELWRLVTGQLRDDELIGVRESEDMPTGNPH